MPLSDRGKTLAIGLILASVLGVLLTPLGGLETRSIVNTTTLGFVTVFLFLTGIVLNFASIVLLFRRVRTASILAIIGLLLPFPAILVDQSGLFSSEQAPPTIAELEIALAVVLVVVLFLASRVHSESTVKNPAKT